MTYQQSYLLPIKFIFLFYRIYRTSFIPFHIFIIYNYIMFLCLLSLFFLKAKSIDNNIDLITWVEQGYHYGYQCTLSFTLYANNFSTKGQYIHIESLSKDIAFEDFDYNEFFIQDIDFKQYSIQTSFCVQNWTAFNICNSAFPGRGKAAKIPDTIYRVYNSTHRFLFFRITIVYCPLHHKIRPVIKITVPMSYIGNSKQMGIKYNKTFNVQIKNLTYRDIWNMSLKSNNSIIGEDTAILLIINFITPNFFKTWNIIKIVFDKINNFKIDPQNCNVTCKVQNNTLIFSNPLFNSSIKKNISRWSNGQYNFYTTKPILYPLILSFQIQPTIQGTIHFQVFVISKFNGTRQFLDQSYVASNYTYHGYSTGTIGFYSKNSTFLNNQTTIVLNNSLQANTSINIQNQTKKNETNTNGVIGVTVAIDAQPLLLKIMTIESINFLSHFLIFIIGGYCFLIILVRRIPFLIQKWIYLWFVLVQSPVSGISYILCTDESERFVQKVFFLLVLMIGKIFFINYLIIFCCSKQFGLAVKNKKMRYFVYLITLFNYRFYYLFYSFILTKQITSLHFNSKFLYNIHSIHLIISSVISFINITLNLNQQFLFATQLKFNFFYIIYLILFLFLTLLIFKTTLISYSNQIIKIQLQRISRQQSQFQQRKSTQRQLQINTKRDSTTKQIQEFIKNIKSIRQSQWNH